MRKTTLIIFPDEWLSHSPTVLNLVRSLEDSFDTRVIAIDDGLFRNSTLQNPEFIFIKINSVLVVHFLRRIKTLYNRLKSLLLLNAVRKHVRNYPVDLAIGIDSIGLWVAQKVFGKAHFLSLEIKKDFYFRSCRSEDILSLVTQTKERGEFLFSSLPPNTFFIPNAPMLPQDFPNSLQKRGFNGKLIYLGTIQPSHGIYACLDAIEKLADEGASLTLKGVFYKESVKKMIMKHYGHLLEKGILILDESYLAQIDMIPFLSQFSIGFCLYDFNLISHDDFNYVSSPSGKLFNYYAAGVPVIGSDVLGLRSVRDFNAGILLPTNSSEGIQKAYAAILNDFALYRENGLNAAAHFDFAKAVKPYRDFLLTQNV